MKSNVERNKNCMKARVLASLFNLFEWIFHDALDYVPLDDVRVEENSSTFSVLATPCDFSCSLSEKADNPPERVERKFGLRKAGNFSSPSSCRCFRCVAGLWSDRKSSDIYFKNEKKRFMRATDEENFDLILFSNFKYFSNFADTGNVSSSASRSFASPRDKCTRLMTGLMISPAEIKQ